jgi:hypothetical protein
LKADSPCLTTLRKGRNTPVCLPFRALSDRRLDSQKQRTYLILVPYFEIDLNKQKKLPDILVAATLVMSNKFIEKKDLLEMWEEIKMLDILEIAQEKGFEQGIEQGKILGLELGMLKKSQKMLIDALFEKFNHTPGHIMQQIKAVQDDDILTIIFRQIFRCDDIKEFEQALNQIIS